MEYSHSRADKNRIRSAICLSRYQWKHCKLFVYELIVFFNYLVLQIKCKLPMHHLLHLHLELRWHLLCLLNAISPVKTDFNLDLEDMLDHNMTELVTLAEGVKIEDYNRAHPFFCNCVRQFWLMLQIFADKMHSNGTISLVGVF